MINVVTLDRQPLMRLGLDAALRGQPDLVTSAPRPTSASSGRCSTGRYPRRGDRTVRCGPFALTGRARNARIAWQAVR